MSIDFNSIKFRASSWGELLAESKTKGEPIGKTCAAALIRIYNQEVFGRKKDITTKQMEKGIVCEQEAIEMFSRLEGKQYYKNEQELENEWFKGHPDIFSVHGEEGNVVAYEEVSDMKCSWDLDSFMPKLVEEPDRTYVAQLNVYYDLTGAKSGHLVYCLVSAPPHILNQEMEALQYRMQKNTTKIDITQDFIKAARELQKLVTFDDIPEELRCIKIPIPRDEELIEKMKAKVPIMREWLHNFHKKHHQQYKKEALLQ